MHSFFHIAVLYLTDHCCQAAVHLQPAAPSQREAAMSPASNWPLKPGHFHFFSNFWSRTGPQDPSGCVGIAEISLGARPKSDLVAFLSNKCNFSLKFRSPSATYPFLWPLIHEYLFSNASTRFVGCFSFRTRSSNLISISQSLPSLEFFENG